MTDQELKDSGRSIALGLLELCKRKGASGDDVTALATNALIEVLGQQIGDAFAVVERLRTLADIMEKQVISDARMN